MPNPLLSLKNINPRPSARPYFFRNLPQWSNEVLRVAMDNALSRRQLRLIWPVADQLDSALQRLQSAINSFTPGLESSPSSLATALREFADSYNNLFNRLEILPLVRPEAGASLQDILSKNRSFLHEAGLECTQDGRRCVANEQRFRQGLAQQSIQSSLWAENGILPQFAEVLQAIQGKGPSSLMDSFSSLEDISTAWKNLVDLEQRSSLVDCLISTLEQIPDTTLVDEQA